MLPHDHTSSPESEADTDAPRRRKGRPAGVDGVGREALLLAAHRLLRTVPPARITTTGVAREAGADPALVRYYFGDREGLLLALAQRLFDADCRPPHVAPEDPAGWMRGTIRAMLRFSAANPNVHRLMFEELAEAKSEDVQRSAAAMNARGVDLYAEILAPETPDALRAVDPLLLHIAVIGLCDAFASGGALLRGLQPDGETGEGFAQRYEDFIVSLVLDGLRPR